MSRIYWLPAIALGLILANAASVYGESRHAGSDPARNQRRPIPIENLFPSGDLFRDEDIERIARALETQIANSQAPDEQDRAERNVKAAEKLADWTPYLFAIAFLEMAITGAGVFLLAKTLGYSKRAAVAAEETLKATRDNAELELRAYLSAEPGGINRMRGNSESALGLVVVKNVGKLPAKNVYVIVHMMRQQGRDFALTVDNEELSIRRSIQPRAELWQGSREEFAVDEICTPKQFTYVYGIVRYDDGYGRRRFTRFSHRYAGSSYIRPSGSGERIGDTIIEPNKARYHETGNDSD